MPRKVKFIVFIHNIEHYCISAMHVHLLLKTHDINLSRGDIYNHCDANRSSQNLANRIPAYVKIQKL